MKQIRYFLFILAIAAGLMISGCGGKEKTDTQEQTSKAIKEINIIPMKIENEPIIAFKFVFHTGSMDDPASKNGLAYLTAQMLAKAGTQTNSYQTILEKLYPIASSYDVQVDREYTTFYGETHIDNIQLFYTLFKQALLDSRLKILILSKIP